MSLTDKEFSLAKKYVYELTGNVLGDNKRVMAYNRIVKLLQNADDCRSVEELFYLLERGEYTQEFINAFTTNKTEFFREPFHFDDLIERFFPRHFEASNEISIYCCASSTGEEPYSIALSFCRYKELSGNRFLQAKIVASDIDTDALHRASEGVFEHPTGDSLFPSWVKPQHYFKKREIDKSCPFFLIKAKDNLRELLEFRQINLLSQEYPFPSLSFDAIFCRNVLIYFSQEDQSKILKNLFSKLKLGGVLYLGHSESPLELARCVERLGKNIFVKIKEL